MAVSAVLFLCVMKFVSWSVALGSGTSGGTLAPLFTIGGGIGSLLGTGIATLAPGLHVDPRIAALVGMASIFAGASRAMLASAVFAFETTLQPVGLLPLLSSCAAAYLVSSLLMRNSIMTEKISRRGVKAPDEYLADPLEQILVRNVASPHVLSLNSQHTVAQVQEWFTTQAAKYCHQGYPVLNDAGVLVGVLTRRDILTTEKADNTLLIDVIRHPPKFVYDDCTLRQAADHMVNHGIGRLPVMSREKPHRLLGIVTRSDVLSGYQRRLRESAMDEPTIKLFKGKTPVARARREAQT
jgi:CBS domain-containing protein